MIGSSSNVTAIPSKSLMSNPGGSLLEVRNLNQSDRKNGKLLQEIHLTVLPREVVSLVCLREDSRSALVEILAGRSQPANGQVLFAGLDLWKHRRALHSRIGFVPQNEIIHPDLTVFEVLHYAAQLRLPPGTNRKMQLQRVDQVIVDLELSELRNRRIKGLKAELSKRVNIGTELLADPKILILDEPASGLNQNGEARQVQLFRRLADQGCSIILITQSKRSALQADKMTVISEGRLAWFGPPEGALDFFHDGQAHPGGNGRMKGFGELLTALENASDKDAEQWAERYRASPAFKNNLAGQQKEKHADYRLDERPLLRRRAESAPAPAEPAPIKVSAVRQFFALTSRGLKLLRRDRFGLPLLLGAPLLGALGELFLTNTYMYDPNRGDPAQIAISLGLLVFFVLLAAGFMWLREIRKEAQIIRRESQAGLRLGPYILSKAWIVALFALYQSLIWTGIHFYTTSVPGGLRVALFFFITLALLAFIGGLIGLVVSSLTQTEMGAGLLLALLVVPQLAFSGALLTSRQLGPLGRSLKAVVPSRFAFEALVLAGGHLKDLQGDACLGSNLFTKCSYPGIRKYQVSEMDQAAKQIQGDSERYRGLLSAGPNGLFNRWMVLVAISAILAAILAGVEKRKFSLG